MAVLLRILLKSGKLSVNLQSKIRSPTHKDSTPHIEVPVIRRQARRGIQALVVGSKRISYEPFYLVFGYQYGLLGRLDKIVALIA